MYTGAVMHVAIVLSWEENVGLQLGFWT